MDPLELALKNYRELSPVSYLQRTHDACVHDIAFDGKTFVLVSESWVGTDPIKPVSNFSVIFSRYRATFSGVDNFELETLDREEYPGAPALADFMREEIREVNIALPNVTIGTDGHEIRFTCQSFDVERFAPTKDDIK